MTFPNQIPLYFLFFNTHDELSHVLKESYMMESDEDDEERVVPFSFLISKVKSFATHQLIDSFLFQIDVDDEEGDRRLLETDIDELSNQYFKRLPFLNDVAICPTLPLFHSVNSLLFVLKEKHKSALPKLVFSDSLSLSSDLAESDVSLPVFHKTRKHHNLSKRITAKHL